MKLNEGELIALDDDKEYIVVKKIEYNGAGYVFLMTAAKPVSILLAKEEIAENGEVDLNPVTDQDEARQILNIISNIQ